MALVTFLSDFGVEDHYVASVKAALISVNPSVQVIDISHHIAPFDLSHAAYVLGNSFRKFPKGTVHLIAFDNAMKEPNRILAVKLEDHFFVGFDTGIFSLISSQAAHAKVEISQQASTFAARDILAPIAAKLASGQDIYDMGKRIDDDRQLVNRQPKLTKKQIVGNIIRVDHYGNLISNIEKKEFEKILELNGNASFEIQFGREKTNRLHSDYSQADHGDYFVLFNSDGYLQIGINKGNGAELLGLKHDSPVFIYFNT
jgi:S-adenosylmethionine hydrolase